jgi:hypothetical protein
MSGQGQIIRSQKGEKCPWCGLTVHMKYLDKAHVAYDRVDAGAVRSWQFIARECPACGEIHLTYSRQWRPSQRDIEQGERGRDETGLAWPHASARGRPSQDVPARYVQDYVEACAVLPLSPKSSAALARRILQMLLRDADCGNAEANVRSGRLVDEIRYVVEHGGLPAMLRQNLHSIRLGGNLAAHPTEDVNAGTIIDIDPDEAEHLLDVVELLFDYYFTFRAKSEAVAARLRAKNNGNAPA